MADAIIVLGGQHDGREELALQLARDGHARQVVLSNPYHDSFMREICTGDYDFAVHCFIPDPSTTQGEAHEIARRAAAEGWKRIIVVTFTPHVSRARYIVGKCFAGDIELVPVRPRLSPFEWTANFGYQSLGYVRAVLQDCD